MSTTLVMVASASLAVAGVCALICIADLLAGHRQHMWIMNVVWPMTALWSGPIGLFAYYKIGRLSSQRAMQQAQDRGEKPPGKAKPFWQMVGVGASHCGAGCTLGDIVAEWGIFLLALGGVTLELFGHGIFAAWVVDYVLALGFGIIFQYFSIKPMKNLSRREGIIAALKADVLSLTAWQVGMYGWMAIAVFAIFGAEIAKTNPVFWFMMQIAMVAGFVTAYPVNWFLIRKGIKEKM
ncbi:MAG TPA: DUF4396 domain-containing protein [Phycisphaerae bacterium]|nr:DUF4396 domain-containing protein [Phycisphaerae bacterium]